MNRTVILKVLLIGMCTALLLTLDYLAVDLLANRKVDLAVTYTAAHEIAPRTRITESDLIEVRVPSAYLDANACQSKAEIVGKYTEIQGMIPAGSLFYKDMLYDSSQLPDHPELQLKEGQAAYNAETDLSRNGGIVEGQRVDVYVCIKNSGNAVRTESILEHARVIAIRDHSGLPVSDPESTGIPYMITLAVRQEDLILLAIAENAGELRFFVSDESYDTSREAERTDSEFVLDLLEPQENTEEKVIQ